MAAWIPISWQAKVRYFLADLLGWSLWSKRRACTERRLPQRGGDAVSAQPDCGSAPRIIALIDLFTHSEVVARHALTLAHSLRAELHFVTLFDHLPDTPGQPWQSAADRFRQIERTLQAQLQQRVARLAGRELPCMVLSGPPGDALRELACRWRADRIVTDLAGARTIHNNWVPWLHELTRLPCPLVVVSE
ncbi:MAG: universal stress protein [Magnetococcales bacterium]|nr:universal stress protein [Magnetococcales bacterium]MBF0114518.1 universal stress protein [Magnetococcales bacterium]